MGRFYNFIYEQLVKSEDDLVGLIAYAIYKKHKIEFITRIKEKEGREPTDDECKTFFDASTTESQLVKYRNDAQSILSDVVANTTNEELERYEREMLADYERRIKKVSASLVAKYNLECYCFLYIFRFRNILLLSRYYSETVCSPTIRN